MSVAFLLVVFAAGLNEATTYVRFPVAPTFLASHHKRYSRQAEIPPKEI